MWLRTPTISRHLEVPSVWRPAPQFNLFHYQIPDANDTDFRFLAMLVLLVVSSVNEGSASQPKGAALHGFPHSRALRLRRKEKKKKRVPWSSELVAACLACSRLAVNRKARWLISRIHHLGLWMSSITECERLPQFQVLLCALPLL